MIAISLLDLGAIIVFYEIARCILVTIYSSKVDFSSKMIINKSPMTSGILKRSGVLPRPRMEYNNEYFRIITRFRQ